MDQDQKKERNPNQLCPMCQQLQDDYSLDVQAVLQEIEKVHIVKSSKQQLLKKWEEFYVCAFLCGYRVDEIGVKLGEIHMESSEYLKSSIKTFRTHKDIRKLTQSLKAISERMYKEGEKINVLEFRKGLQQRYPMTINTKSDTSVSQTPASQSEKLTIICECTSEELQTIQNQLRQMNIQVFQKIDL
jgi:hypothetical protein